MLQKCANPVCYNQFRYLHQGKLFEIEIRYVDSPSADNQGKPTNGKGHVERCWLCDQCAANVALRFDRQRGLVIVCSSSASEEVVTSISQSGGKAAADIARIIIRP